MDATDPVCGMNIDPASTRRVQAEHAGIVYSFCSSRCRDLFLNDPARVLAWAPPPTPPEGRQTYTCLMHPGIVRSAPSCPICSLALEPRQALPSLPT
ncbi:MAG: YHS domain-containing protein [Archangium sp.]|nr:YHS domain-containing protein [Archangium sp.]